MSSVFTDKKPWGADIESYWKNNIDKIQWELATCRPKDELMQIWSFQIATSYDVLFIFNMCQCVHYWWNFKQLKQLLKYNTQQQTCYRRDISLAIMNTTKFHTRVVHSNIAIQVLHHKTHSLHGQGDTKPSNIQTPAHTEQIHHILTGTPAHTQQGYKWTFKIVVRIRMSKTPD